MRGNNVLHPCSGIRLFASGMGVLSHGSCWRNCSMQFLQLRLWMRSLAPEKGQSRVDQAFSHYQRQFDVVFGSRPWNVRLRFRLWSPRRLPVE
ncbi:MAG TPA: hypothetical protein PLL33_05450 [Paracoccus sp. (in: a-proteobacteria)]|nr:hypothetical protein [Paracoccus sp. (in: a-proteobacteria)]